MKVYQYNGNEYDLQATTHDDGTVDGDSSLADHFRDIFARMEDGGHDPAYSMEEFQSIIQRRYNSGYYKTAD
jgi:hypothetical protein